MNPVRNTIFITVFGGAIAKNILRTDVFKILKSKLKVILLVPPIKRDYYRQEFGGENTIIEPLPKMKRLDQFFFHLGMETLHTKTVANRQKNYFRKTKDFNGYILRRTLWFLAQFKIFREFLRTLYHIIPSKNFSKLFKKYRPDLIFAPNIISPLDIQILKEAKKKKIKTLGMIKSWDSLTAKTFLVVKPDFLIVHNLILKDEAIRLGDFPENKIFVSGVPQWDIYFDKNIFLSREEFFKKNKLDPTKKLLLYCGSANWIAPYEAEVIEILNEAIEEKKINFPCQILVRPHPKYKVDEAVRSCKNVILDQSSKQRGGSWEQEREDISHLANSLYHCDLMLNTASTMTIEAAILDKPVINIGFDGYHKKDYLRSVIRYFDTNHYKNIIKTEGVRVAKTPKELIWHINDYLANPKKDSRGREKIRKEQCYKLDGKSGERIGNYILKLLK